MDKLRQLHGMHNPLNPPILFFLPMIFIADGQTPTIDIPSFGLTSINNGICVLDFLFFVGLENRDSFPWA